MDSTGTISPTTTLTNFYSTDNIRSGVAAGAGNYYFTGSSGPGSGIMFSGSSGTNQIADINSRQIQVRNGNLLYSTGSGTRGIYSFNGLPTSTTNASSLLTGVTGQGTSPYDFTFSPDGNTLYVADDGIGVQRFNFSNGSWTHAYNLTNGLTSGRAFGLHVDFGSSSNDVFWTSASDTGVNSIWKASDAGSAVAGTTLLAAGSNYAFRGLEASAVPEPSSVALLGFGTLALLGLRRLNQKS